MSRGGYANRQIVILMIQVAPPPRPACFRDDKSWKAWLISAHLTGLRVARIVDIGKSQGCRQTSRRLLPTSQIDYCHDCPRGHEIEMAKQGRCVPSAVRDTAVA